MTDRFSASVSGTSGSPFALAVLVALILIAAWWLVRRLPVRDRDLTFSADAHLESNYESNASAYTGLEGRRFFNLALFEKIVIASMVGIIFAQVLPGVRADGIEIIVGGTILILVSIPLSQLLARLGFGWVANFREFMVMLVLNFVLILLIAILLPTFDGSINLAT